jgi:hypothetical protein
MAFHQREDCVRAIGPIVRHPGRPELTNTNFNSFTTRSIGAGTFGAITLLVILCAASQLPAQTVQVQKNQKIAHSTGGFGANLANSDFWGNSVASIGDLDNDGVNDLAAGAPNDDTGNTDRGAVYVLFMNTDGTAKSSTKIADNTGGFSVTLTNSDFFGISVANVGDLDNDGLDDLAVGANGENTGGGDAGAAWVLLLNSDGTVKSSQKIASGTSGFTTLTANDQFGRSVAGIGDLDNDGVEDLAVGAWLDPGGTAWGAVYLFLMNTDGTFKSFQKLARNTAGFNVTLAGFDQFGQSVAGIGDLDNDGFLDLAVGANGDDTGGADRGAVYVLFMVEVSTITAISPKTGKVGDSVTITGTNFDATAASNKVLFGATKATVTAASTTSLTATVPTGATFGPVSVPVNNRTVESDDFFTPTYAGEFPTIDASTLAAKQDFTTGAIPSKLAIGDLDGDGKPDLAIVNASVVSVFRNKSTSGTLDGSSFFAKQDFTTVDAADRVRMGDLDLDGELDLVVSRRTPDLVSVFHNMSSVGAISFAGKEDFATTTGPTGLAIGDMDGDGKLDLVAGNVDGTTVSVLRNLSTSGTITTSSFAAKVDFTTGAAPSSVAVGDLDADGKPEIVAVDRSGTTVSVLGNTSIPGTITTSSFAAPLSYATETAPVYVAIGDVDGDGKPELAVSNEGNTAGTTVSVYRNTSSGGVSFAARVNFTTGAGPRAVSFGDLDGDGKHDLAVVNLTPNTVSLLRNTSVLGAITTSSFAAKVDFPTGANPLGLGIGDLDGDSKPDLAVGNFAGTTMSLYHNLTTTSPLPTITSFTPSSAKPGESVTITGTNFDATPTNNTVFFDPIKATVTSGSATSLTVTVPDGAGYGPLTATRKERTAFSDAYFLPIYTGVAQTITAGTFAERVSFTAGNNPNGIAVGDIDGDGLPDVAIANQLDNDISLFRNTATLGGINGGSFAAAFDIVSDTGPITLALGDLDGDGKLELVAATTNGNISVFHNTTSAPGTINGSTFAAKVDFVTGTQA